MVDVSIIIVSYNTRDILLDCLSSIEQAVGETIEIIVVDNNSSDGSASAVKDLNKKYITLIENKENLGFSKANNIGIKKATGKYILFLNSDTIVYKDTIPTMVKFMDENPKAGIATCRVELKDGSLDDASHRGYPTPWNALCYFTGLTKIFSGVPLFSGYTLSSLDLTKTHQIDACAGAFMIVRRQAGEAIGWWDEDYFFYGEDLDFCYMAKQKGWEIYFVPETKILHLKGVSGGIKKQSEGITKASGETKKKVTYERFRAMELFYAKHYKNKYPFFITSLVMIGINLKKKTQL